MDLGWPGKLDKDGNKIPGPAVALPFQTVETVNESSQQRQRTFKAFNREASNEWRNRLIWGDNKYVLPSLIPEFQGKIDLIYIDPPFATGQDFSFPVEIGTKSFEKEASIIEQKAYRDTWGKGFDSYLSMIYERLTLMRELLNEAGSIYVHMDAHVGHYVKVIMDEIFGDANFQREIVWDTRVLSGFKVQAKNWIRGHDTIYFYTKGDDFVFNKLTVPHRPEYIARFNKKDAKGRKYFDGRGERRYLEEVIEKGKAIGDVWDDIMSFQQIPTAAERLPFPTQKPEALLDRIIRSATNEGGIVADFFCGSGTTLAVAERLGRRWIGCDISRFAVHTTRKRLLSINDLTPFVIQNLGKYERQAWQTAEFGADLDAKTEAYRRFILELYHAIPATGFSWIHGSKGNRLVHVGSVDSPISASDIGEIVAEFRKAIGSGADAPKSTGVDVLGWDFAFELNEVAKQEASRSHVDLRFRRIPRDVLDPKAIEQGDIRFFELSALDLGLHSSARSYTLELTDFVIPPDDVPEDVRRSVNHWIHWVDYWAIDWDNRGDTFHNEWQSFRSRQESTIKTKASHTYPSPGDYTVLVKVVDILGNDTTKAISVRVR